MVEMLAGRWSGLEPGLQLTGRERDVVRWSAEGKTVEDIAVILGISPHTVGEHLKNVRRKLGTINAAHTIAVAIQLGELRLDDLAPRSPCALRPRRSGP